MRTKKLYLDKDYNIVDKKAALFIMTTKFDNDDSIESEDVEVADGND